MIGHCENRRDTKAPGETPTSETPTSEIVRNPYVRNPYLRSGLDPQPTGFRRTPRIDTPERVTD